MVAHQYSSKAKFIIDDGYSVSCNDARQCCIEPYRSTMQVFVLIQWEFTSGGCIDLETFHPLECNGRYCKRNVSFSDESENDKHVDAL